MIPGSLSVPYGVEALAFPSLTDLRAFWYADENSGTTFSDSSGNGFTGTLTNSGLWTSSGKINAGIQFDGTNTVNFATTNNLLGLGNTHSLIAWVYVNASTDFVYILDLNFQSSSSISSNNDGQAFIYFGSGGAQFRAIFNTTTLVGNIRGGYAPGAAFTPGWNLVQMGRTQTLSLIRTYNASGVFAEFSATRASNNADFSAGVANNRIGIFANTGNQSTPGTRVDEISVWNRILDASEFAAIYNAGAGNRP
jgi:hypothetical protein